MKGVRRPSDQTMAVLSTLAERPPRWRYGYDLCQETGLKAGSMYPILMRLADRGWLETAWETEHPPGRPPRHLYRATKAGIEWARQAERERSREAGRKQARLRAQTAEGV